MTSDTNPEIVSQPEEEGVGCLGKLAFVAVAFFIAVPMTVKHHEWFQWIPWVGILGEMLITFLVFMAIVYSGLNNLRSISVYLIFGGLVFLTVNQFRGKSFDFSDLGRSYISVINNSLTDNPEFEEDLIKGSVDYAMQDIREAADYNNPVVKQFANRSATAYFTEAEDRKFMENGPIVRYLSTFKYINSRWKYVEDPKDIEYFAKASETILSGDSLNTFTGDCDDHTILMSACLRAVGAEVAMVVVDGHIYPVLNVGEDNASTRWKISALVRDLFDEEYDHYDGEDIHFMSAGGFTWLNLDYTRSFPGGPFMDENYYLFDPFNQ